MQGLGIDAKVLIEVDVRYFPPSEVDLLVGDPSDPTGVLQSQSRAARPIPY